MFEGRDGNDRFLGDFRFGSGATGAGFPTISGSSTMRGGEGEDRLEAAAQSFRPDRFDGGNGRDTVDYSPRTTPVTLSSLFHNPDFPPNDGAPIEGDDLDRVETFIGGEGPDDMFASFDSRNRLFLTQELFCRGSDDRLRVQGNLFGALDGGLGADTYTMEAQSHIIAARDGVKDTFDCGPATELINADLRDPPLPDDCAPVSVGAVDEGPNVVVRSARVTVARDGSLRVRLDCPGVLTERCAGRLAARLDRAGRRFGRGARYAIEPGGSRLVETRLPAGERRAARRPGARVRLRSVEQGLHGVKTTIVSLATR